MSAVALLLVHAILLAWSASRHSPSSNEVEHLVAGLSHWRFGTFDLGRVNPPLVRMVASVPVLVAQPRTEWARYDDRIGYRSERAVRDDFVEANGQRVFQLVTMARWTCIPFSLIGASVCFWWARELYGHLAGIVALALWCLSPNIIGYGQLVTPDAAAAALGMAATYAFWRWLRRPTWTETFIAGLMLGLAELTKLTWILLFGLWPLLWVMWRFVQSRRSGVRSWSREMRQLATMLFLGVFVLNLGYGFEGSFARLDNYGFVSEALGGPTDELQRVGAGCNRFAGTWLGKIAVPFPRNYVAGIDLQKWDFERKMWSYLRGEWRLGGWWYYYLYVLAVKVPLGGWLLGLVCLGAMLGSSKYSDRWGDELVLLAPAVVVVLLVSSQTGFNHHLRYVLPVLPFAFVWTSKIARAVEFRNWWITLIAGVALPWFVTSSLWCYPHSLSYFNELAGGSTGAQAHLLDSNIDWGQDLLYLKRWLDEHPEARPLGLRYYPSFLDPQIVGIEYTQPLPGPDHEHGVGRNPEEVGPKPGWYALSVSEIRGRHKRYAYFLRFRPVATAGYSIYIHHLTLDEVNRVRRQLALPALRGDEREAVPCFHGNPPP